MNYYNPYFNMYPYASLANTATNTGLLGRAVGGGGIKWSSILSGTQKVLGIANQAIPMIKQVTPVMKNARTMFRVMNEFKKVDTPVSTNNNSNINETSNEIVDNNQITSTNNDGPTFFL